MVEWKLLAKFTAHTAWWMTTLVFIWMFGTYHLQPIMNEFPESQTNLAVAFLIVIIGVSWYAGGQMNELLDGGDD